MAESKGISDGVRAALRAGRRNVGGVAIATIARKACGSDGLRERMAVTAILAREVKLGRVVRVTRGFYALGKEV